MKRAVTIVLAATALRLIVAAFIPLFPDETYYWEWSRRLSPGYFDHPYGIALLIRAGTAFAALVGAQASPLAVRLFPVLAGAVGSLAVVATANRLAGAGAAVRAAVVLAVIPLAAAGLVLATPDAPLLGAAAVGLYAVVCAIQAPPGTRAALGWWMFAGAALGAAFSSKYTSILLPVGVTAAVLIIPALRARLREPGPYVACLVATGIFLPVLLWNARHHWLSFGFQIQHGLGAPSGSPVRRELDLLGGQAGLASPILFGLMVVAVWRGLARARSSGARADGALLAVVAAVAFGFFCLTAIRRPVEANWPSLAYIPAFALVAAVLWTGAAARWWRAGCWLAGGLSAAVYMQGTTGVLPVPARRDPTARAVGWDALADSVGRAKRAEDAGNAGVTWLGADRYQDASEIAFHTPGNPVTFSLNLSGRANEYDLWPGFPDRAGPGDNLVLALDELSSPEVHSTARALVPYFRTVDRGSLVILARRGDPITRRRVWICRGWRGGWPGR